MWWDADTLGHMSGLPTLLAYSFLWYILQSFGFSNGIIQVLLASILFTSSGLAMFYFLLTLIGKKQIPSLVGSIFYMINISVMLSTFNVGMNWMRAFLPLVLALFVKLLRKRVNGEPSRRLLLCFILVFSFSTSFLTVNPPILVISFLCLGVVALYVALAEKKVLEVSLESMKILAFSIIASLWWIVPFGLLASQNVGSLAGGVNVWDWSWTHSRASILNILWFNADWGWLPEYYPFMGYYSNPIVILTTFVPMVIAAFGLLFNQRNRVLRYFFISVVLLAIFLTKGLHPPFEQVNALFYEYIPWFAELFREPVSKFTLMATLFLAPLVACSVDFILTSLEVYLPSKGRLPKKAVSFSLVAVFGLSLIISSAPMFLGFVVETKTEQLPFPSYVRVPNYWFELGDYLSKDTNYFRVLVTPDDDFYQMPYKWGYYGSDALPLRFTSKPVLYHTYGYQQKQIDQILDILYLNLENGDPLAFNNLLNAMNVKYILLRNDILWDFNGRRIANPEIIKSRLNDNTNIEFMQSIGELDIFRYKNWEPLHFYTPTRVLMTDSSLESFSLLSRYIDLKKEVVIFLGEQESIPIKVLSHIPSYFVLAVKASDFNQTHNEFFKDVKLYTPGMYMLGVLSNQSLTISIDGSSVDLSNNSGSFMTSDVYLEEGTHRIGVNGLSEEKSLSLESWKNTTVENQFGAVYTLEIEQDALKATLYNSTWGWKTLISPILEIHENEKYTFSFEVRGNNVHQLHAKVLEYDENLTFVEASYGGFLFEGNFEWIPVNVTYAPLRSETRYAQLQLLHGHETDNSLPNIIWLRDARVITDRTAGFDGLLMFQNHLLSEELETEKSKVELSYLSLSPYKYRIHIDTEKPFLLVFSESYDPLWKIMEGDQSWYEAPFRATLSSYHLSANGFGNIWYINKTGRFDITIFYTPQAYFYYASVASSLFVCIIVMLEVVRYLHVRVKDPNLKRRGSSSISLIVFGSPMPLGGIFIRTRQLMRALSTLNRSLNVIELGYRDRNIHKGVGNFKLKNAVYQTMNCVSQAPSKGSVYSPMRQMALQVESLKILRLAKLLRKSRIVILTSCLQIFPALISKFLGAKIILDINDVNSRVTLRVRDTPTRTIRYFFWRPLESFGCMLANIILVNKEEEGEFLIRHLHVHPSKILVIKTCLEERQNESDKYLKSELKRFNFEDKRIVLFLANMTAFMNQRAAHYIINEFAPSFAKLDEFGEVIFVLAGIGSDKLQPLTSNVITTGTLSETSVHALINRADICIDPSVISGGVKTKVQFYLKRGKVIVTTPAGAEGINLYGRKDLAFLISPIEHFDITLNYALMNLEHLKKLAINNPKVYEKQFSWETFLEQVTILIQRLSETSRIE